MHDYIKMEFIRNDTIKKTINIDLDGEQQDCPKGDRERTHIDGNEKSGITDCNEIKEFEDQNAIIENLINQTYELCKSFLFPLLALLSRSYRINDFKEILVNKKTAGLLKNLLRDKKIDIDKDNYITITNIMNSIIDNNSEIINNIREIYCIASHDKLRGLIEKHFIPTIEEKKNNAEIPTPVHLVDEMLNVIPVEFWTTPKKVFEPCCGKGNFVLGIFDKFYKGLKEQIPDETERCEVIMTECLYYADLTTMNVFITTEILKCHIQSYTGLDELDYKFNSYVGDTLDPKVEEHFTVNRFDAVIGNPPYSTDPSRNDTKPLYDKFTEQYIDYGKLLLFVVPSRWFVGGKGLNKFREFMLRRKDIVMIRHEDDSKKWFGNKIEIKGGVNYFLKSDSHNNNCSFNEKMYDLNKYDCIIKPEYHEIIDIVKQQDSIDKMYMGRYFKVETNDKRYKDEGKIKCYVSSLKSKDRCKYIDSYDFTNENTFWKVITARAAYKAFSGFGTLFIGKPDEIHTSSYISFRVENEEEAKSLMSYLQTKIVNHLLSIRKISQDISENTCKWIPLVPLDRIWTDDLVCDYLKIDKSMYM
jgi:site-specific DNA-methyltransferase (adenine-specific)